MAFVPRLSIRDRMLALELASPYDGDDDTGEVNGDEEGHTRRLQEYVDADFESFQQALLSQVVHYPSARRWVDRIGGNWFDALLFSDELVAKLASSMIDAVSSYISPRDIPDEWWQRAERARPAPVPQQVMAAGMHR